MYRTIYAILLILLITSFLINTGCAKEITECSQPSCIKEDLIVSKLIKESLPFRNFYNDKRQLMPKHIHWIENLSLPKNILAVTDISTNTTYIGISHTGIDPKNQFHSFIIAHELCAYVLQANGYPTVNPSETAYKLGVAHLASLFNDMFWTPRRDIILGEYGFNVSMSYSYLTKDFFNRPYDENNRTLKYELFFDYVRVELYWRDVLKKTEISDIRRQGNKLYPNLTKEADDLVNMILKDGYYTPEQAAQCYKHIITSFGLGEIIEFDK